MEPARAARRRAASMKSSSSAAPIPCRWAAGCDREQQQFGLVGDGAQPARSRRLAVAVVARERQRRRPPSAGSRRIASASRPRRSGVERRVHDRHDRVEIVAAFAGRERGPARGAGAARSCRGRGPWRRGRGRRPGAGRASAARRAGAARRRRGARRRAPRRCRAPRPAPRRRCRRPAARSIARGGLAGGRLATGAERVERGTVDIAATNNSPCPPCIATATGPVARRAGGEQRERANPASGTSQPIARPCAAAIADAHAGEAAGADADQDLRRDVRPPSRSAIIGTSRSAWPRPISSSALGDAARRRRRTARRCRPRSTCRSPGSSRLPMA